MFPDKILVYNPTLTPAGPIEFEYQFVKPNPPVQSGDMIDLHSVSIFSSPGDIADWPITVGITKLSMSRDKGLAFEFDKTVPENWKWMTGHGDDNYQYTVWAGHASGMAAFIQMWQGRFSTGHMDVREGNVINWTNHFHDNWAYDPRWGSLNSYMPSAGEKMFFLVSAGNGRDQSGVSSVRERSQVIEITLPPDDEGMFNF